jgi:sugar-specific transcriptional regulator TrmB
MDELIAAFRKLGFAQYEARAYIALLKSPYVTGYELSKQSGIPQSKIYEVIDKLAQKELVVWVEDGGYARYLPVEPKTAMARYREEYTQAMDVMDEELQQLYQAEDASVAYVVNLVRISDIVNKANAVVRASRQRIYVMIWPEELPAVREELVAAEARGVAIAVCVYGNEDPHIGVTYCHQIDEVVLRNQGGRRMVLVADDREALVAHFMDGHDPTAHWSSNRGFVEMGADYVRHEIWNVRMMQDFGPLITEKYGPSRERLRDVFWPGGNVESAGQN